MKRILRILGGLLLLLAIIFFVTGLIVKETTYQVSTTINKPIEEVFKVFNDQSKLKEWIPAVKVFEPIEEKEGMVGSTYRMVVDNKGTDFEMKETVTAFEENKRVGLEFAAQGMLKTDDIVFTSDGTSTTITNNASCKGTTYLTKCMFPYLKGAFIKTDKASLDNFKNMIESL